jgi:hypothetical protein
VQLDQVARRVVREGLAPGANEDLVAHDHAGLSQLADRRGQVADLQGEVLALVTRDARSDQVHLLAPSVQPGPGKAEVGPVGGPVHAVIESMTGARFVHDTLERAGWAVDIADAQKVKGLAPLACKTDKST